MNKPEKLLARCGKCNAALRFDRNKLGNIANCPKCETVVQLASNICRPFTFARTIAKPDSKIYDENSISSEIKQLRSQIAMQTAQQNHSHNRFFGALLSAIFPGLGQFYQGKTIVGPICIFLTIMFSISICFTGPIGMFLLAGLWVCCVLDAIDA